MAPSSSNTPEAKTLNGAASSDHFFWLERGEVRVQGTRTTARYTAPQNSRVAENPVA